MGNDFYCFANFLKITNPIKPPTKKETIKFVKFGSGCPLLADDELKKILIKKFILFE